jgi:hypothetical protein
MDTKWIVMAASITLIGGCVADDGDDEIGEIVEPGHHKKPDAAPPPPPPPPDCPVTLSCYDAPPSGSGWWLANTDYCAPVLTCKWGNFSAPYYTETYIVAPTGCTACAPSTGTQTACGTNDSPTTWTCDAP